MEIAVEKPDPDDKASQRVLGDSVGDNCEVRTPPQARDTHSTDQVLRTAALVGVSFGLLLSSAGNAQSEDDLKDALRDGGRCSTSNESVVRGNKNVCNDMHERVSICSLD